VSVDAELAGPYRRVDVIGARGDVGPPFFHPLGLLRRVVGLPKAVGGSASCAGLPRSSLWHEHSHRGPPSGSGTVQHSIHAAGSVDDRDGDEVAVSSLAGIVIAHAKRPAPSPCALSSEGHVVHLLDVPAPAEGSRRFCSRRPLSPRRCIARRCVWPVTTEWPVEYPSAL
jgi:hypothetical protein